MLEDATNSVPYDCDGVTTSFPITFEFHDSDYIRAFIRKTSTKLQDELVNPDDFYVDGSNLKTVDTWGLGYRLLIFREHPESQETHLQENAELPSATLEQRLDKLTMMVQDLKGKLRRALLLPETASDRDLVFPEPNDKHFLEWQSGKLQNTQHVSGTATCTEYIKTFLDDPDAATARNTLDVAPANKGVTNGDNHDHVGGDGAAIVGIVTNGDSHDHVGGDGAAIAGIVLPGIIEMYGGAVAPAGWLLCDNAAVSRETYAALFAVIGTTFGVGDGSTTFNVPDIRGIFPRGAGTSEKLTNANAVAFAGVLGTYQNDKFQGHKMSYLTIPKASLAESDTGTGYLAKGATTPGDADYGASGAYMHYLQSDGTNGTPRKGAETNPANLGLTFIIKY